MLIDNNNGLKKMIWGTGGIKELNEHSKGLGF